MKLKDIRTSRTSGKKYDAIFEMFDGSVRRVPFGGSGYKDFIQYSSINHDLADDKRKAYISRHQVNEDWTDPMKPGTLSRFILWEHRTLPEAVRKYKSRFNV